MAPCSARLGSAALTLHCSSGRPPRRQRHPPSHMTHSRQQPTTAHKGPGAAGQGVPRRGRTPAPARSVTHAASALHCTAWHDWVPGPLFPRTALSLSLSLSASSPSSLQSLPAARQPPAPLLSPREQVRREEGTEAAAPLIPAAPAIHRRVLVGGSRSCSAPARARPQPTVRHSYRRPLVLFPD